ncbi:hypothetical protein LTR08_003749 [Meristemomyces frigidus]|nr:hypothetical protein LTR08_003749 [Meristemomyces frigidus]
MVRHWDHYLGAEKNGLWYGKLSKTLGQEGRFGLSPLANALEGSGGLESPMSPFGGTDNFDVSPRGIVFVAKDLRLNPALNTTCHVYVKAIGSWSPGEEDGTSATTTNTLRKVSVPGYEGACTSPVFDAQGGRAAFLMMKTNGYEADRNTIFVVELGDGGAELRAEAVLKEEVYQGAWDRSPSSIAFSADGKSWLAVAEDQGHARVFELKPDAGAPHGWQIRPLTSTGYVSAATPLQNGRVFVSASSLVDNSWYAILDSSAAAPEDLTTWHHSNTSSGSKLGLRPAQVSSIWTPASNPAINKEIHSWVFKPSTFDASKKYPVAYLIHGGPQGSWADSWSTRWNPAVFAEQGYIVVAPNVTGSTGYGQQFTDSIRKNWGGDPYQDIVNAFEWVGANMAEADNERAVALGASYGGYMMNWIQGHPLGRKFSSLVCHDGIFSFAGGLLATEELYFPFRDLGSTPWYNPESQTSPSNRVSTAAAQASANFSTGTFADWRQWDPSEHLAHWTTPQLVIHSSKDYRLPLSEGLATFNVLQARGVESQFLCFPDENHFVLKPENSLVWHKTVLNFVNKSVGLPAYTEEDPEGEGYFGGRRREGEEAAEMPAQGKPET